MCSELEEEPEPSLTELPNAVNSTQTRGRKSAASSLYLREKPEMGGIEPSLPLLMVCACVGLGRAPMTCKDRCDLVKRRGCILRQAGNCDPGPHPPELELIAVRDRY